MCLGVGEHSVSHFDLDFRPRRDREVSVLDWWCEKSECAPVGFIGRDRRAGTCCSAWWRFDEIRVELVGRTQ